MVIPHVMFEWEEWIPLVPWTIIPYWSENFFYGLAILLTINYQQLKTLGLRLFSVQLICVMGFLLVPLQQINIVNRPEVEGFLGFWFNELMKFDLPYNQAPSLHISLLIVLWQFYADRLKKRWHLFLHCWAILIGLSVLTTWQHHFIDIPAGVIAGCLAIWIFPTRRHSPFNVKSRKLPLRGKWALLYFLGALGLLTLALALKGVYLWLLYIAFSLLLVSINYMFLGKEGFPKEKNGYYQFTNVILFAPYILIAWINAKIWTRDNAAYDQISDNLYVGSIPTRAKELASFISVVDCCAEIPFFYASKVKSYLPNYCLDMTTLSIEECHESAHKIAQGLAQGKTLVFCALGYSRSVTAILAYLVIYQECLLSQAIIRVKSREGIVINSQQLKILKQIEQSIKS